MTDVQKGFLSLLREALYDSHLTKVDDPSFEEVVLTECQGDRAMTKNLNMSGFIHDDHERRVCAILDKDLCN